eukprot:787479-Prymnesium_polylepis.1
MNSEPTAPADRLRRSAAQQNGLRNPPPTAALVAREARAVDWTARVDSPHGRAEVRPSTASFLQLHPSQVTRTRSDAGARLVDAILGLALAPGYA